MTKPGHERLGGGSSEDEDELTARRADRARDEVLGLVADGLSNEEISVALVVTMHTAKAHIGSRRSKLHARDRAQLVIAAYEHGFRSAS